MTTGSTTASKQDTSTSQRIVGHLRQVPLQPTFTCVPPVVPVNILTIEAIVNVIDDRLGRSGLAAIVQGLLSLEAAAQKNIERRSLE